MKRETKRKIGTVIFHLVVGLIGIVMVYPLIWMVFSSFKESSLVLTTVEKLIPQSWRLDNYLTGWRGYGGTSFGVFFKNSIIITTLSTIGNVFSSALVAYGFSRIRFKGRKFWFVCMMLTMMMPTQILMIPQYVIFNQLGWVNTFLPVIVPEWLGKAFFIFLIMQFIAGIPTELDEAAKIDGCSRYSIFIHIILPLTKPAMITSAIFAFYWKWDDFLGSLLYLNSPENYTVSMGLKMFADPTGVSNWGALFAMCTLSLVPIFILFISLQKYIVDGVTTTGLKG